MSVLRVLKSNLIGWMYILYVVCTITYSKVVGTGVQATEEEVEDLIMEAIYNSEGAGAYTFNRQTLGDSYPNTEFDWVNSKYSQSEIVPGAEYLIITVGCNDEGGQTSCRHENLLFEDAGSEM